MIESYLRFNLHGILSVLSGLLCLGLGIMVVLKDRNSKVNRAFFFFTLNAAIWIIFFGAMSLVQSIKMAEQLVPFAYIYGVPFIAVHNYLFSVRFRGMSENKKILWLGYLWAIIVMLWMWFRLNTTTAMGEFSWGRYSTWPKNLEARCQFLFLIIPFYFYSLLGFKHLYRGYREADHINKLRFRNCLIAFIIAYTGSVDFITAQQINVYAFGYLSLTGFTAIVAYTIIRHQLLDIRIVLKKLSLILAIYLGLFIILLPLTGPLLRQLLSNPSHNPTSVMFSMGALIGVVFSLGPLIYAYLVRHSFWLKTNVTTGLTHELKSPLSVIHSALDIIKEDLSTSRNKTLSEYLPILEKNVVRMETYVKDLLNLARIQESSILLQRDAIDLTTLIQSAIEGLTPLADKNGLKIFFKGPMNAITFGDRDKLHQVVSSLISNAIKFSDEGVITVTLWQSSKELFCSVADDGRGIAREHIGKIFDRFYQASPSDKGSGIGLTIAKAWVEAHGGKIWVESEGEGKGAKVTFTIPI